MGFQKRAMLLFDFTSFVLYVLQWLMIMMGLCCFSDEFKLFLYLICFICANSIDANGNILGKIVGL